MLTTLNERDARTSIEEMLGNLPPGATDGVPRMSPRVARLYAGFRELPDDQRIEFMQQLSGQAAPRKREGKQ